MTPLCLVVALAGVGVASACSSTGAPPAGVTTTDAAGGEVGGGADAGPAPLEPAPPPPIDAKDRVDSASSTVIFDRLRGGVWTANGDVGTITYADITKQAVVREVPIGTNVTSVALSPDFTWIAAVDRAGASVSLVDATSGQVRRSIPLGTHPRAAVWDAWDPRWLYVSLEDDGAVAVIDRTLGVLHHTVPVGRLPAGLAASRLRDELAIAHRIDGVVSVLPLAGVYAPADQGVPAIDVPLAFQPVQSDDTLPSGTPFALESLAWTIGGDVVWTPHQLLANHHPFQFQRVLFPAVSVVDLSARAEVETDPNNPLAVIAGRKLLFDAINIPDADGNTSIMSQPCAAVMHPNGLTAYVVACGSEDLLTFDLTAGIAVDLLRNLPGDHPTGITLDAAGQRAFIVADQSHSLLTLDTAGGSLVGHAQVIAGPLDLVAKDPITPQLRAGEKLFFEANSAKNPLPTTGNNWMSCGGCHLDGFVSTNQLVFEALHALDPTTDAQIAHEGLKDMFSTSPTPADPSFNPHDILSALIDQGGLVPDRTGAVRTGQIDPSNPTAAAVTMAQQLAQVIARDLPVGPSWLVADGAKPVTQYDEQWCGNCHAPEYAAWQLSAHAHAAKDTMVLFGMGVEQKLRGTQYSRQCAGCHDPVSLRLGDSSLASGRGITCLGCHDVTRLIRAGGNSDLEATTHDWTQEHLARASASLATLKTPDFCAGCHQQFVPGTGMPAISTLTEWQSSPYAVPATPADAGADAEANVATSITPTSVGTPGTTTCVDCHMPDNGSGTHDHSAPGGNVYIAQTFNEPDFATTVGKKLSSAVQLQASAAADGVHVLVMNVGAGHAFPTGVTDIREPYVEVQALDAMQNLLATYGGPDSTGAAPAGGAAPRHGHRRRGRGPALPARADAGDAHPVRASGAGTDVDGARRPRAIGAAADRGGARRGAPLSQHSHAVLPGRDRGLDGSRAGHRGGSRGGGAMTVRRGVLVVLALAACDDGGSALPAVDAGSESSSTLVDATVLERGEYLVRSVAGCGECHTPRDAEGNLDQSQWLAGVANRFDLVPDDDTMGGISAGNLTPFALSTWSDAAIKSAFLDGVGATGAPSSADAVLRVPQHDRRGRDRDRGVPPRRSVDRKHGPQASVAASLARRARAADSGVGHPGHHAEAHRSELRLGGARAVPRRRGRLLPRLPHAVATGDDAAARPDARLRGQPGVLGEGVGGAASGSRRGLLVQRDAGPVGDRRVVGGLGRTGDADGLDPGEPAAVPADAVGARRRARWDPRAGRDGHRRVPDDDSARFQAATTSPQCPVRRRRMMLVAVRVSGPVAQFGRLTRMAVSRSTRAANASSMVAENGGSSARRRPCRATARRAASSRRRARGRSPLRRAWRSVHSRRASSTAPRAG